MHEAIVSQASLDATATQGGAPRAGTAGTGGAENAVWRLLLAARPRLVAGIPRGTHGAGRGGNASQRAEMLAKGTSTCPPDRPPRGLRLCRWIDPCKFILS